MYRPSSWPRVWAIKLKCWDIKRMNGYTFHILHEAHSYTYADAQWAHEPSRHTVFSRVPSHFFIKYNYIHLVYPSNCLLFWRNNLAWFWREIKPKTMRIFLASGGASSGLGGSLRIRCPGAARNKPMHYSSCPIPRGSRDKPWYLLQ